MARPFRRFVLAAWIGLLGLPGVAAGQDVVTCGKVTTKARFVVTFDGTKWKTTPPAQTRISDRDRVEVCVEHFNFLRYALKFDVAEEQSEAYGYLTRLWTSILNPVGAMVSAAGGPPPPPNSARPDLITKLHKLYVESRGLDTAIGEAAGKHTKTGLTAGDAGTLKTERDIVTAQLQKTRTAFNDVDALILGSAEALLLVNGELRDLYRAVVNQFRGIEGRAEIFLRLSGKAIGVELKQIGKKKAGTKVTFALVAVDESGAATPMDDVDYFVQSNMPLVAHGGLSFSGLRDVSFSKVRRATGFGEEDLFQEQSSDDVSTGFALFLGWQFYGSGDNASDHREGKVGVAFSLGTDIDAPGKRVFAGPSILLFKRFVVSGGAVFGKEGEGGEAVVLEPNLFRIVREKPTAKWFFAISTKVY